MSRGGRTRPERGDTPREAPGPAQDGGPSRATASATDGPAAAETPGPAAAARWAAFSHPAFRVYWPGQLFSLVGTWMQSVAQSWLVLQQTDSAWMVGLCTALQFTPVTVLGLVGGVLSDRVNKRRMLLFTQSAAALQALVLGILTVTGQVRVEHVLVLAGMLGLITAFDMPLRQSFVVEMVGRADLMQAIALNSAAFNTARILGPAIGGVLIARIGVGPVFLLNAASFATVLASLAFMRERDLIARAASERPGSVWQALAAGMNAARRDPLISTAVLLVGGVSTFGMNYGVVLSVMARDVFQIGSQGFGLLMAATGIGSVAAGLFLAWRTRPDPVRWLLLGGTGVAVLQIAFALSPRLHFLPAAFVLLLGVGFSAISMTATANNLVQQRAPDAIRGSVLSVYLTAFAASVPLGGLFAGSLARAYGAPVAVALGGVLSGLVVLAAWWRLRRRGSAGGTGRLGTEGER